MLDQKSEKRRNHNENPKVYLAEKIVALGESVHPRLTVSPVMALLFYDCAQKVPEFER